MKMKKIELTLLSWLIVICAALGILYVLIFVLQPVVIVPAGRVGVELYFGKPTGKILTTGLNWKGPIATLELMDTTLKTNWYQDVPTTLDRKPVFIITTVAFSVIPSEAPRVLEESGQEVLNNIVIPATNEIVRTVVAKYNLDQVVEHKDDIEGEVAMRLRERLEQYGINMKRTVISDLQTERKQPTNVEHNHPHE